jgi:hypothetical protein
MSKSVTTSPIKPEPCPEVGTEVRFELCRIATTPYECDGPLDRRSFARLRVRVATFPTVAEAIAFVFRHGVPGRWEIFHTDAERRFKLLGFRNAGCSKRKAP